MTTLRTVHELQQPKGQSRRDQGTPPDQVTIMFGPFLTKTVAFAGPLTSPDLPPTLWRTGRETKPRRIGINLQKNTIQVLQKKHRKLTYHEACVCSFSDGDWRCPSASSKIPDWAPHLPGGPIFKAMVENTAEAFYSGTSGIEAAPNSGPKSKWGSYSEAARREIQRNDEKPGKSRWYYFILF